MYIYSDPIPQIEIDATIKKNGSPVTEARIGDSIDVEATFSDNTLNFTGDNELYVSIVDRDGRHILNISMKVENGVGTASFTVSEPKDYCLRNAAINYWKDRIPFELKLKEEKKVRVK